MSTPGPIPKQTKKKKKKKKGTNKEIKGHINEKYGMNERSKERNVK
jgi:hypothetical protein